MPVAKEALRDLLAVQNRQMSIENIQKTVADYYKIRVSDMHSKKRSRAIARPRQVAMALAKELTATVRCRRSEATSAGATTRPSCTPARQIADCGKRSRTQPRRQFPASGVAQLTPARHLPRAAEAMPPPFLLPRTETSFCWIKARNRL